MNVFFSILFFFCFCITLQFWQPWSEGKGELGESESRAESTQCRCHLSSSSSSSFLVDPPPPSSPLPFPPSPISQTHPTNNGPVESGSNPGSYSGRPFPAPPLLLIRMGCRKLRSISGRTQLANIGRERVLEREDKRGGGGKSRKIGGQRLFFFFFFFSFKTCLSSKCRVR